MPDPEGLLRHVLEPASGTRLRQDEYGRDFESRLWLTDGADSWKLERMRFYDESGFPSWDAFTAGDWERSLELYDSLRPELLAFNRRHAQRHARFRRVRVVAAEISPYLHWEMHCLKVRAECGESIRMVPEPRLAAVEASVGPVPDLVSLCGTTLYVTVYDTAARPDGARRFTDPAIVAQQGCGLTSYSACEQRRGGRRLRGCLQRVVWCPETSGLAGLCAEQVLPPPGEAVAHVCDQRRIGPVLGEGGVGDLRERPECVGEQQPVEALVRFRRED